MQITWLFYKGVNNNMNIGTLVYLFFRIFNNENFTKGKTMEIYK